MVPVECVARGYLTGCGLAEYRATGAVSGVALPPRAGRGLAAARADLHADDQGAAAASTTSRSPTTRSWRWSGADDGRAAARAHPGRLPPGRASWPPQRGILIADTKLEFGRDAATGDDRARRRGADPRLVAVLAGRPLGSRGGRSSRSTSSTCATGRPTLDWDRTAPGRRCPPRSSPRPAPATSRPTSGSPACPGPRSRGYRETATPGSSARNVVCSGPEPVEVPVDMAGSARIPWWIGTAVRGATARR